MTQTLKKEEDFLLFYFPASKGSPESNKPEPGPDARAEISPVFGLYGTPPHPHSTKP